MFWCVVIEGCKTNIFIAKNWVFNVDEVAADNNGVNRKKSFRIFYSIDDAAEPDFTLPVAETFDEFNDRCYFAKFKKAFRSREDCKEFIEKQRPQYVPVYSRRVAGQANQKGHMEVLATAVLDIKIERNQMASAIGKLLPMLPLQDLTTSDIAAYQDILAIDDDDQIDALEFDGADPLAANFAHIENNVGLSLLTVSFIF